MDSIIELVNTFHQIGLHVDDVALYDGCLRITFDDLYVCHYDLRSDLFFYETRERKMAAVDFIMLIGILYSGDFAEFREVIKRA